MAKSARSSKSRVRILDGPNLNLLGTREPRVYGREKLSAINRRLMAVGQTAGTEVVCYQSNVEGELIERIQQAARNGDCALKTTALKAAAGR